MKNYFWIVLAGQRRNFAVCLQCRMQTEKKQKLIDTAKLADVRYQVLSKIS